MKTPLTDMVRGYLECVLWSTNDESDEQGGEPLDRNYCLADFSEEAVKQAEEVCRDFLERCAEEGLSDVRGSGMRADCRLDSEQGGHDLWLTSVGHGAGFWDGDWEQGDKLTMEAKEAGLSTQGAYVGDDGLIYLHG